MCVCVGIVCVCVCVCMLMVSSQTSSLQLDASAPKFTVMITLACQPLGSKSRVSYRCTGTYRTPGDKFTLSWWPVHRTVTLDKPQDSIGMTVATCQALREAGSGLDYQTGAI